MPLPAACLFDLDGLLLDTEPLHAQAWSEAARHFALTLSERDLLHLRGRRRLDCVAQVREWICARTGGPAPSAEALLAVQQPVARRLMPTARPVDGAESLVARCQEHGVPMALVTSSTREAVDRKCAPHGWLRAITLRVMGDDPELAAGKPAPDPYLLAARRLLVEASRCWAFEDSLAGAQSALAAGCQVHVLLPPHPSGADGETPTFPASCRVVRRLSDVKLEP
ncbi:MAG: HAD family phosphatase [Cyanobacteriota bacterium]|nr:HAD family phosphatase [Cyanobacteriota bacterium]